MKILTSLLICTTALLAALPVSGCADMEKGKSGLNDDVEIIQPDPDEDCPDDGCENDCPDGECPDDDCDDGCPDKQCPECPENDGKDGKKRPHTVFPRGNFRKRRKPPVPPKAPVEPPKDGDVILPDPPVDGELPQD